MDLSSINPVTNPNSICSHFIHAIKSKPICNALRIFSEESYGTSYRIDLQVAVRHPYASVSIEVSQSSLYTRAFQQKEEVLVTGLATKQQ
jgi:hypothetical protein